MQLDFLKRGNLLRKINTLLGLHWSYLNVHIFSEFGGGLGKHTKKELSMQSYREEN